MPGATITVGNVEITAVHDNEGALPLSMVFPGVDAELWVPYQQKYPECFNGENMLDRWRLGNNCIISINISVTILANLFCLLVIRFAQTQYYGIWP